MHKKLATRAIAASDNPLAQQIFRLQSVLAEKIRNDTRGRMREWMDSHFKDDKVSWKLREDRLAAIKKLMEIIGKNVRELGYDDYQYSDLGGMLKYYYEDSTYNVLVELGIAHSFADTLKHGKKGRFDNSKIYPLEQDNVKAFCNKRMRIAAIKWVVWNSDGNIANIGLDDFRRLHVERLLSYYDNSVYNALVAAGYAHSIKDILEHAKTGRWDDGWKVYPWQLKKTPRIWHMKEIRIAAVKWLVRDDDPKKITREDFINAGLGGLLATPDYYKDIPYLALAEAGYAYTIEEIKEMAKTGQFKSEKIYPWEMNKAPAFVLKDMVLKKAAMQWLAQVCKKEYRDIISEEFRRNGLRGLIGDRSAYETFLEVGLVTEADKPYMDEMKIRGLRLRQIAHKYSQTLPLQ